MRIQNPGPRSNQQVKKYIQRKLTPGPRSCFQLVMDTSPSDALLALDGGQIRGLANHLRIAPGTSALANLRLSSVGAESAASAIVESVVKRASDVGNSFVSCIPGNDRQPSEMVLKRLGFERHVIRTIFGGGVKEVDPGVINQSLDMNEVLGLLKELAGHEYLTLHFRPVPLSVSTLNYATSHGALFLQSEPERGGVLAFETPCVLFGDGSEHLIPYSLSKAASSSNLGRTGEISVMGGSGLQPAVQSALAWLRSRGLDKTTVYASQDKELGILLMKLGFSPRVSQDVWTKSITGPIDFYLGS